MNPILDALSTAGYVLDTPGAYLRGALAGTPGSRASGRELLQAHGLSSPDDPWGGVKGFGAELAADPLNLLGAGLGSHLLTRGARALSHADDAVPLLRRLGELKAGVEDPLDALRYSYRHGVGSGVPGPIREAARFAGDEVGALAIGRAPFLPSQIRSATRKTPVQMQFEDAARAYQPWIEGLTPEERSAIKLFTETAPQPLISHSLRGSTSTAGGQLIDPWDIPYYGGTVAGVPPIKAPEDIMSEVVPYIDSGLSRTSSPRSLMTYRLAQRHGALNPETAESLLGQTVTDPSYLSTTLTPWGRFYGQDANPRNLLLDMVLPKGGRGGYVEPLSRWSGEKELLVPRNAQFKVAAAQRVPVEKIGYDWHRLDLEGKPIPKSSHSGGGLFSDIPEDELADLLRQGQWGDILVPDRYLQPDWNRYRAENLQAQDFQTNVLLEQLTEGLAHPHQSLVRRRTPLEAFDVIAAHARPGEGYTASPARIERQLNMLRESVARGEYPDSNLLETMIRDRILPGLDVGELYRSFWR